jgi:conjugative transfer signal peptidase TraF
VQDKDDTTGFAILANGRENFVISARGVSWLSAGRLGLGRLGARQVIVLVVAFAVALAVNLAPASSLRVNLGSSMPRGLYRLTSFPPLRGSLVSFCIEPSRAAIAIERGYVSAGRCPSGAEPLLKRVVAVAGDVVTSSKRSVEVNGTLIAGSATLSRDSSGRPLAHHPFGLHRLAQGELWVFSPTTRSWDSRYFGPVRGHQVVAVVEPLLTFE